MNSINTVVGPDELYHAICQAENLKLILIAVYLLDELDTHPKGIVEQYYNKRDPNIKDHPWKELRKILKYIVTPSRSKKEWTDITSESVNGSDVCVGYRQEKDQDLVFKCTANLETSLLCLSSLFAEPDLFHLWMTSVGDARYLENNNLSCHEFSFHLTFLSPMAAIIENRDAILNLCLFDTSTVNVPRGLERYTDAAREKYALKAGILLYSESAMKPDEEDPTCRLTSSKWNFDLERQIKRTIRMKVVQSYGFVQPTSHGCNIVMYATVKPYFKLLPSWIVTWVGKVIFHKTVLNTMDLSKEILRELAGNSSKWKGAHSFAKRIGYKPLYIWIESIQRGVAGVTMRRSCFSYEDPENSTHRGLGDFGSAQYRGRDDEGGYTPSKYRSRGKDDDSTSYNAAVGGKSKGNVNFQCKDKSNKVALRKSLNNSINQSFNSNTTCSPSKQRDCDTDAQDTTRAQSIELPQSVMDDIQSHRQRQSAANSNYNNSDDSSDDTDCPILGNNGSSKRVTMCLDTAIQKYKKNTVSNMGSNSTHRSRRSNRSTKSKRDEEEEYQLYKRDMRNKGARPVTNEFCILPKQEKVSKDKDQDKIYWSTGKGSVHFSKADIVKHSSRLKHKKFSASSDMSKYDLSKSKKNRARPKGGSSSPPASPQREPMPAAISWMDKVDMPHKSSKSRVNRNDSDSRDSPKHKGMSNIAGKSLEHTIMSYDSVACYPNLAGEARRIPAPIKSVYCSQTDCMDRKKK